MKKIIMPLAGMLAVAAFAPEASAIPAFSRQVGMACNACHAQHFPVLNNFGRAFKSSGYTMMGEQGKVEGEHMSIPVSLNASLLLKYRHVKRSGVPGSAGTGAGTTTGDGQWQMGDELSLFAAGRVSENIGFMLEANTLGTGENTGNSLLAGFKSRLYLIRAASSWVSFLSPPTHWA